MCPVHDSGSVIEVLESDKRGLMCGDFIARSRVPVQPWIQSSVTVCTTIEVPHVNFYTDQFCAAHH